MAEGDFGPLSQEYLQCELAILDHYLELFHHLIQRKWETRGATSGLFIAPQQAESFWQPEAQLSHWRQQFLQSEEGEVWRAKKQEYLEQLKKTRALAHKSKVALPLFLVEHNLGLNVFEKQVLVAVFAAEWDSRYQTIYGYLQDNATLKFPTAGWLGELFFPGNSWDIHSAFASDSSLFSRHLVRCIDPLLNVLRIDSHVKEFLLGLAKIDPALDEFCQWFERDSSLSALGYISQVVDDAAAHYYENRNFDVIIVDGSCQDTQRHLVRKLMAKFGMGLLSLSLSKFAVLQDKSTLLRKAIREAQIHNSGILCEGAKELEPHEMGPLLLREIDRLSAPACISGGIGWQHFFASRQKRVLAIQIPPANYQDRLSLWQEHLSPRDAQPLANQYQFTPGEIYNLIAVMQNVAKIPAETPSAQQICQQYTAVDLEQIACKITTQQSWQDLVLPQTVQQQLREICDRCRYSQQIYQQWNFASKLLYAPALAILFTGPPGTGKTMAASIIAREIQQPIYKIELSQVVSKYIGETEKNLERIFSKGEKAGSLLFFDEADALFGKRSETKDAHDRYANIEISYLLQRLERYPGVVILATNFPENIDTAFLRRFAAKIAFPLPDAELRKEIWQRTFPLEAPLAEDVDFTHLSSHLHIAGGNIKNIVLAAAFLAASQNGAIGMEHLLHAARREYHKIGKPFPLKDRG